MEYNIEVHLQIVEYDIEVHLQIVEYDIEVQLQRRVQGKFLGIGLQEGSFQS